MKKETAPPETALRVVSAEFVTSAVDPPHYPPAEKPEVAFAGRSNVGKSSLINTLVNRKRLVKTSRTPGRTQLINFFDINRAFSFVDLPGYGYAKVPAAVKKNWGPMVTTYLSTRTTLKGVVLLLDIRRTPGPEEGNFIDWLAQYRLPAVLVLTKADKLSKSKQIRHRQAVASVLGVDPASLIRFSAKSRQGKKDLWTAVAGLLPNEKQA